MNCLKCGRTVADGELLCPACSGRGPHPEPEAKIHVHAHHKVEDPVAVDHVATESKLEKKIRRLRQWLVAFFLVCIAFAGLFALQFFYIGRLHAKLDEADKAVNSANMIADDLKQQLETSKDLLNDTEEALAQKDLIIAAFEEMTGVSADSLP